MDKLIPIKGLVSIIDGYLTTQYIFLNELKEKTKYINSDLTYNSEKVLEWKLKIRYYSKGYWNFMD
jgi:hypothetical protein